MMRAELISVGSELVSGHTTDTNSPYIARKLAEIGIQVSRKAAVVDEESEIISALRDALQRADLVVLTGGLGPTADDLTAQAVARALGEQLELNAEAEAAIRERLRQRGIALRDIHLRMARMPSGSALLRNTAGTAPGFIYEKDGKVAACLPGVPSEMRAMTDGVLLPILAEKAGGAAIRSRVLRFAGIFESALQEKLGELAFGNEKVSVAFLPEAPEVHIRLTASASGAEEAERNLAEMEKAVLLRVGEDHLYGRDDEAMESVVGRLLREAGLTLAAAESCTGGLVGHRITQVAGSSDYFIMDVVAYSNEAKTALLGVPQDMLMKHGAVSAPVAMAMARGAKEKAGADIGISTTGIAGPMGATPTKPVGLVYIGVSSAGGDASTEHMFAGDRQMIKERAAFTALDMVRRFLLPKREKS